MPAQPQSQQAARSSRGPREARMHARAMQACKRLRCARAAPPAALAEGMLKQCDDLFTGC